MGVNLFREYFWRVGDSGRYFGYDRRVRYLDQVIARAVYLSFFLLLTIKSSNSSPSGLVLPQSQDSLHVRLFQAGTSYTPGFYFL